MKTLTQEQEHAHRLKKAYEKAPKGSTEAYLKKVDLIHYVDARRLERADYGLKPKTVEG